MSNFDLRLDSVLREMAELSGWQPTRDQQYLVYFGDEEIDSVVADSEEDAIRRFLEAWPEYADKRQSLRAKTRKSDSGDANFSNKDIEFINSDWTRLTIQSWLNNNPLNYRFIFVFAGTGTKPTPGAITFIKSGNAGGDALTPHMILHTLGHALVGHNDDVMYELQPILQDVLGHELVPTDIDDRHVVVPICKLLHMNAAKLTLKGSNRGFPTFSEMLYEITGVYVKNGKVKIAPNEFCDFKIGVEHCQQIQQVLHNFCNHRLDLAVGRIVYDE